MKLAIGFHPAGIENWPALADYVAAARIPDDLIRKCNLIGTEAMVRERLRVYRAAGHNTLRITPEGATAEERRETLARPIALVREVEADATDNAAS
ncbi:MAG TPA: hypothetical protein VIL85_20880 [Thermomicrobiales bacterium]|jgi:hypothetical protein